MAAAPNFPSTPKVGLVTIVNADASNLKTVYTGVAAGSKVIGLSATSDDTSDRTLQVYITRSGTDYLIGSAVVADLSGTNGVTDPAVNLLNYIPGLPTDSNGVRFVYLQDTGDVLKVKATTTVTAAKTVAILGVVEDF